MWKQQKRATDGKWYAPEKLKTFNLSITYADGELRTFLNGLLDQTITVDGLVLGDVTLGGFNGQVAEYFIYNRRLSQNEIKSLSARVDMTSDALRKDELVSKKP